MSWDPRSAIFTLLVILTGVKTQSHMSFLAPLNDANIDLSQIIFLPSRHQSYSNQLSSAREERQVRFPEDDASDVSDEYITNDNDDESSDRGDRIVKIEIDDEIGSGDFREDLVTNDDINTLDLNENVSNEEANDHGMSGSYAYFSEGVPYIIDWMMMNDGSFQFTHPQPQWLANDYYHNSGLLQQQDNHHHYKHLLQDADAAGAAAPTAVANDAALDNEFEVVKEIDPYDQVFSINGNDLPAYSNEVFDAQYNSSQSSNNILIY